MRKISLIQGKSGIKNFFFITAIVLTALVPYGCSKSKKETPTGQEAQQAMQPGREHFNKGIQFALKGQHDDAIKEFEETLKYNPNSAETYNNLGFEYMDKGDLDKAIDSQNKALQINPNLANAYYGLAMALEKKGDKEGALKNWKEFLKFAQPHTRWWMNAQTHIKDLEKKKN